MILNIIPYLTQGLWREAIIMLLFTLVIVVFTLSIHETAHGYVAYKMGDPTAKSLGRLTLNPAKHIDPIGFIAMLIFGFGWAKPVPINTRYFRKPKWGMALTGIAGPISNFIMGVIGAALYGFTLPLFARIATEQSEGFLYSLAFVVPLFFELLAMYNFIFMAFNLIPLPPFDGSRFFYAFLPTKVYFAIMKYEKFILMGLLVGLFVLSRFFNFSPFAWIAEKVFYGVSNPFFLLGKLLFL